jgi:hypothetical protein
VNDTAELIRAFAALAWPAVALIVLLIFREPIRERISTARRLKAGPFEGEWDGRLAETQAQVPATTPSQAFGEAVVGHLPSGIVEIARANPGQAIVAAHGEVEKALREKLPIEAQPDVGGVPMSVTQLARVAYERDAITEEQRRAIDGLTVMRNLAVHDPSGIDVAKARDFLSIAAAVLFTMGVPPESNDLTPSL